MTDTNTRSSTDIETDIVKINEALFTISELRSSLRSFKQLVQQENKGPTYVNAFGERLNLVKNGVNRLTSEAEGLKGALVYAQVAAKHNYDWLSIKDAVENDAAAEERRQAEIGAGRSKDPSAQIKKTSDQMLRQLSSVVLERRKPTSTANFITTHIDQWLAHEKPNNVNMSITFDSPEHDTMSGSACCVTIAVEKALRVVLSLNYHNTSDTLVVHRYEMKSANEEKNSQQDALLFQKLNVLADSAFQDMGVMPARESLSSILHWIASYHNLFTEPCFRCNRRLQFDSPHYKFLPPMVRTWVRRKVDYMEPDREMPQAYTTAGMAYHMLCFVGATKVAAKINQ
ncbi:hypothetical protein LRAMOSA06639 [Lichtheimia ramosa]|uniref:Mediator complex subunit 27 n=1 Tax=Lichtheimia ramosa TaxID=688394 RepID=A0A077X4G2_9FUNG|nr:hypothetical protein LRAMOSA06639 [Lichtheimia ramosa]